MARRGRGLRARARRRCAGDFVLGFFLGARVRPAVEPRLDAPRRGGLAARGAAPASAAAEQQREPGAEAQTACIRRPSETQARIVFFLGSSVVVFVFVCLIVRRAAPDNAGSAGEGDRARPVPSTMAATSR